MKSRLKKLSLLLAATATLFSTQASAMGMLRSNDTLIMYGHVEPADSERFRQQMAKGDIRQIVLSESPGGDMRAAYTIADLITKNNIHTAVQGNCYSACAMIFMAGTERQMVAGKKLASTRLGFHGPHNKQTHEVARAAIPHLREWLLKATNGKFPEEILDRAMNIDRAGDMMIFYYPGEGMYNDIRFCTEGSLRCESVKGHNVVSVGVLTTAELLDLEKLSPKTAEEKKPE
ncbi:ATP-dependent Clp protease proteolytic subunit [Undibacterium sp. TS12]|uniref:ATP-dependent Clp protease proteolytic subunit n=1 Tax=Undibacterium sp. TS12 TaxID=2908202 RepID=UPI001F4C9E50|nr:ATP-dependent Clp protease proteolytic subunit [Undibacterium sp. TS12]MCH8622343.1 ATP-dependent Clp protease proteolytic subunit [Undibacterium sp. TS12]